MAGARPSRTDARAKSLRCGGIDRAWRSRNSGASVMEAMDTPATRRDLFDGLDGLGTELRTELHQVRDELRAEMRTMEDNLFRRIVVAVGDEVSRQIRATQEQTRDLIRAIDDKYEDLPDRVSRLEAGDLSVSVAKLEAAVFPPPAGKRRRKAS